MQLNLAGAEAEHERALRFMSVPDAGLLLLTLLRLRNDVVMMATPQFRLCPRPCMLELDPLADVATSVGDFLRASGAGLLARSLPPRLDRVESALDSYAAAIAIVRDEGLTRCLPTDVTERFFALLRAGADAVQFARSQPPRGGMGAIAWPDELRYGVHGRLISSLLDISGASRC